MESHKTDNIPEKFHTDQALFYLHDLLSCAKLLGVSNPGFSENMTMKDINRELERHILDEVHPYKLYQSGSDKRWFTYVHDETCPRNRRLIKRTSYDSLCKALIEHYREKSHADMKMNELFDDWAIFRRDETSAKPGTVRKDVSIWRTYCKKAMVDRKQFGHFKVTEISPQLLYKYFRSITKDRTLTHQTVNNTR